MKIKIYCIIDINGLKYVGKTENKYLCNRLKSHRYDKKNNRGCSSELLDLYNCEMILLCECEKHEAKYREQYFKDNIKCVNKNNPVFDKKKSKQKWINNNIQYLKQYKKQYTKKEKYKQYQKEYKLFRTKKVINGCYEFIQMLNSY